MSDDVAIIVLTFNSAAVIERTVRSARQVSRRIICVDSASTDTTVEILQSLDCEVHQRPFKHYSDQRNWAINNLGNQFPWQLHLDADEILDDEVVRSIRGAIANPHRYGGYLLHRRSYFLGRALRFGGASSWHLRLFRTGACEERLYDQHFICDGPTVRLRGWMHDVNAGTLTEWTARHNRWSDLEAKELLHPSHEIAQTLQPKMGLEPRQRRRAYKGVYYRAPYFARAWAYFLFRYVFQLGFLDGRAGFLYAFFQALWFRMLVDAKLDEASAAEKHVTGLTSDAHSVRQ